jgi:hypothetical protein
MASASLPSTVPASASRAASTCVGSTARPWAAINAIAVSSGGAGPAISSANSRVSSTGATLPGAARQRT